MREIYKASLLHDSATARRQQRVEDQVPDGYPVMATIKCTMHTCLREHCNKTSCQIRCEKAPKEQAIACRG